MTGAVYEHQFPMTSLIIFFQKSEAYWYKLIYIIHNLIVAVVHISENQHIS